MKIRSYAKVNLYLSVTGKRDDGYHNINSLITGINLFDLLHLTKSDDLKITCNMQDIPLGRDNIITKTYKEIKKLYPESGGIGVNLYKNIPPGAGLGGGSSNAAAFLSGYEQLYGLKMEFDIKKQIMSKVGSDTVFFLYNNPCIARGRGEDVSPVDVCCNFYILLVKPDIFISTGSVYNSGILKLTPEDTLSNMPSHFCYDDILHCMNNDLESVVLKQYPIMHRIKKELQISGADNALLSGSGATLYGLYSSKKKLEKAYGHFKRRYPGCFVEKTCNIKDQISHNRE